MFVFNFYVVLKVRTVTVLKFAKFNELFNVNLSLHKTLNKKKKIFKINKKKIFSVGFV